MSELPKESSVTGVKAVLTEALAAHRWLTFEFIGAGLYEVVCRCGEVFCGRSGSDAYLSHDSHAADAVLALSGVAVIQLPEPDADGEWDGQDFHCGWWVGNRPSYNGKPGVMPHIGGAWLSPNSARHFAAALLAAAVLSGEASGE